MAHSQITKPNTAEKMTEFKFKMSEISSYMANGSLAVWGIMQDLNKVAIITGILLGVGTFVVNSWFAWRRDQRETKALESGLQKRAGP